MITDAWLKGIRDFNGGEALDAMIDSATREHFGLDAYHRQGFIGSEDASESVSRTLEYAYDDGCIARMADDLAVVPVTTLPATAARGTEGADLDPDPAPPPRDDPEPAQSQESAQPTEPAQLRLEAITMRDDGPVAIVSGRIVREGDVFDGIAVVRIGATEIELLIQAEARTLVLRF